MTEEEEAAAEAEAKAKAEAAGGNAEVCERSDGDDDGTDSARNIVSIISFCVH